MADKSDLRRVPAFADLPDEQLDWFLANSQEVRVTAGDVYIHQGEAAEWMFVILEGEFQWRGELGAVIDTAKPGDVSGVLPFSRMKRFNQNFRALSDARLLKFPVSMFSEFVQKMPELTTRLVGLMSDRVRAITRGEQQRERLASLGKLSAGLAHELNNPASAATPAHCASAGQAPASNGRNAVSPGMVATSLSKSHSPWDSAGDLICTR